MRAFIRRYCHDKTSGLSSRLESKIVNAAKFHGGWFRIWRRRFCGRISGTVTMDDGMNTNSTQDFHILQLP
jgi:hypothetical protein